MKPDAAAAASQAPAAAPAAAEHGAESTEKGADGLTVGATTTSTVQLSWNPSTDNNGVAGYYVYRDGGLAATVTGTSFVDTGRTASTTYEEPYNTARKFDIPYFQRIKSIFTRRARQLEKRRARHQEAA